MAEPVTVNATAVAVTRGASDSCQMAQAGVQGRCLLVAAYFFSACRLQLAAVSSASSRTTFRAFASFWVAAAGAWSSCGLGQAKRFTPNGDQDEEILPSRRAGRHCWSRRALAGHGGLG